MIESKHINSAFDKDLDHVLALLMRMGGLVEQAIQQSALALHERNTELAELVIRNDRRFDGMLEEVNAAAVSLIARRQPQAKDLRMIVSVIRIAQYLERVGDYAKNISKRSFTISLMPPVTPSTGSIKRLANAVQSLMKDSLDAFVQADSEKATDVIKRDIEIDQMYNSLFREFLTHMMENPKNITPAMHLLFVAKNFERIGDYATAVGEQAIYRVTGALPSDVRQRQDWTPYAQQTENDGLEAETNG